MRVLLTILCFCKFLLVFQACWLEHFDIKARNSKNGFAFMYTVQFRKLL